MTNEKIEGFLEKVNMNYLFCLLSKLEAQRINQFPSYVKQKFDKKITVLAMEHVADNEVPDYITELQEAEMAMAAQRAAYEEDDEGIDFGEETIDDSAKFTQDFEQSDVSEYDSFEEVVKDPFADNDDDDADEDDFDDDDDDDL
jgi:cysteinyl-tRNA synthetase